MKSADELIRRFLAAADEERASALLQRLIEKHADRAIKELVRRKLRVDLEQIRRLPDSAAATKSRTPTTERCPGPMRGRLDAEELYARSLASLLTQLWDRKENAEPISDFAAYVHEIGVNTYRRLLRQQLPAYPGLRRRLLELVRDGASPSLFALWPGRSPGEQIFGFRAWHGRSPRLTGGYWRWLTCPGEIEKCVLHGESPSAIPMPSLVTRVLEWVGAPMDVDDLVIGLADLRPRER